MDNSLLTTFSLNGRAVDLRRGVVTDSSGHVVTLRPQTAEVLKVLAVRPEQVVSKDELMRAVWGDIAVTDDSLVQCIAEIRKALGDDGHEIVRTLQKRGYVLEVEARADASVPSQTLVSRPRYLRWIGVGVAAVLLVATGAAWLWPAPQRPSGGMPSVAVLPFDDMSAERNLGYLGDGVAEDIIAMLASSPDVSVMARNSSFAYRDGPVDVRRIGAELGAEFVLEGSVRREAGQLRIVAQLNDTKTGAHLWAAHFDKAGSDPFALQDEVTGRIIGTLTGDGGIIRRAKYREAWGKDSASLGEYDYHVRLQALLLDREFDRCIVLAKEGLDHYPGSALINVKLGFCHYVRAYNGFGDDFAGDYRLAGELARLLTQNKQSQPPFVRLASRWLLAYVLAQERDFAGAVREAEAVQAMAPHSTHALWSLSEILIMGGHPEKAIEWTNRAVMLDPANIQTYARGLGWAHQVAGRPAESAAAFAKAEIDNPISGLAYAISLHRVGRHDEAMREYAQALAMSPITAEKWRQVNYYSDPSIVEAELADLRTMGFPEK